MGSGPEQTNVNGKTHWLDLENLMRKLRAHGGMVTPYSMLEREEKHCANSLL